MKNLHARLFFIKIKLILLRAEFRISPNFKKRSAEEKREKRSFARPKRDGARQGREIFQQKNILTSISPNFCLRFSESIELPY